jgi:hypothetical protein
MNERVNKDEFYSFTALQVFEKLSMDQVISVKERGEA